MRCATTFRTALKARHDGAWLVAGISSKYNINFKAMEHGLTLFASTGIVVVAAILNSRN